MADVDLAARRGSDASSPLREAVTVLLLRLARAVQASWQRSFKVNIPDVTEALAALGALPLPNEVTSHKRTKHRLFSHE